MDANPLYFSTSGKSTPDEIRQRFDADVERFSNLDTGQTATMDAPLVLELVAQAAAACTPHARHLVDVGCGAGNYTLKLLQRLPGLDCTLIDLSRPMLERASRRVGLATSGSIETVQGDIREISLANESCDVIVAAMVLHHLRTDDEWRSVFAKFYQALRPGGSVWIADHLEHSIPAVQQFMQKRWGNHLEQIKGSDYREKVFAYVAREDTPRPILFQTNLLRSVGFQQIDVLHLNTLFAAFGGVK